MNYTAKWDRIANVSFEARSDYHAKLRADKIARELQVTHTPRIITSNGRVVESILTGITPKQQG